MMGEFLSMAPANLSIFHLSVTICRWSLGITVAQIILETLQHVQWVVLKSLHTHTHTHTHSTHSTQKVILGVFFGVVIFNLCVSTWT